MNSTGIGGYGLLVGAVAAAVLGVVAGPWWAALTAVCLTAVCGFMAGRRPGPVRPSALVLVGALALDVAAVLLVPGWLVPGTRFVAVFVAAGVLPWFAGRVWSLYSELTRAGWERAGQLERERRLVAEQARLRERHRIAQDMHDVLGHELSLIALSAGALKLAPGLDEERRKAADDIRTRAGTAVERLGEVIGVLREETEAPPKRPSGDSIARLISEASASGLAVEAKVEGEPAEMPEAAQRAVHRVVQEGLTNVAKHAPGTGATVQVTHSGMETVVVVENGGAGTGRTPAAAISVPLALSPVSASTAVGGHGLVGLDERVRLSGGTFASGPREDGGFAIRARLPHSPPAQQPPRPTVGKAPAEAEAEGLGAMGLGAVPGSGNDPGNAPGSGPGPGPGPGPDEGVRREHHFARRRLRRTLLASLTVPLAATALAGGGLTLWDAMLAKRSVLEREDYARLRVGQERAEVAPYLPDRQAPQRPAKAPPAGEGTRCEFYAMTADRFDDRSGDVYRLCFRGDTLASAKALVGR